MGWLIYDLTNSASWLGRIGFASAAPTLLLGLLGGAIIEHTDRKRVLYGSPRCSPMCGLALARDHLTGVVEIWMIILISLVVGHWDRVLHARSPGPAAVARAGRAA